MVKVGRGALAHEHRRVNEVRRERVRRHTHASRRVPADIDIRAHAQ